MKNDTNILHFKDFLDSEIEVMVRHYNHKQGFEADDIMIKHWEEKTEISRENLKVCPCCGSRVIGDKENYWVGAHVVDKEQKRYITPTCNSCNSTYKDSKAKEKWFSVKKDHLCTLP